MSQFYLTQLIIIKIVNMRDLIGFTAVGADFELVSFFGQINLKQNFLLAI
jgi:hypothetical protein